MRRLGYARYVAQGGDQGAGVTDAMGRQAPEGLVGIHLNFLRTAIAAGPQPDQSEEERAAAEAVTAFRSSGFGYFLEQTTRPQTIGYALLDSPVALAAWMLDHDTDSYYKISRAFVDGQPSGNLTRDHILDNITLYWLTSSGASAARSYWEGGRAAAPRPARAPWRSVCRSASPRSPMRFSERRRAGSRRRTPPSTISTRSTRAATSPPGKSHTCSQRNFAPLSVIFAGKKLHNCPSQKGQYLAVLVDEHGDVRGAPVLATSQNGPEFLRRRRPLLPGRSHRVPGGVPAGAAELDREGVPQSDLLQRS